LIAIGSLLTIGNFNNNAISKLFIFIGQPVIALLIGVGFAFLLLRNKKIETINSVFETAIEKAGPILIVTAAGGMFGMIIKATGVGTIAAEAMGDTRFGLLVPFAIALILKTAQGSSTVAIITSASIVMPMLNSLGLDSESGKLFTLLALGSGSMMVSHANDSYFWVIAKFSGIQASVTLRVFTSATAVMGITVFLCVWIASLFII
jgi:GntP family gluconate:H+ symporter